MQPRARRAGRALRRGARGGQGAGAHLPCFFGGGGRRGLLLLLSAERVAAEWIEAAERVEGRGRLRGRRGRRRGRGRRDGLRGALGCGVRQRRVDRKLLRPVVVLVLRPKLHSAQNSRRPRALRAPGAGGAAWCVRAGAGRGRRAGVGGPGPGRLRRKARRTGSPRAQRALPRAVRVAPGAVRRAGPPGPGAPGGAVARPAAAAAPPAAPGRRAAAGRRGSAARNRRTGQRSAAAAGGRPAREEASSVSGQGRALGLVDSLGDPARGDGWAKLFRGGAAAWRRCTCHSTWAGSALPRRRGSPQLRPGAPRTPQGRSPPPAS
jgi:hypothetical protein